MKTVILMMLLSIFSNTPKNHPPLKTVDFVDLEKYAGKWYDIAHLPARFMKNCENTTAEYGLTNKTYIRVKNRCKRSDSGKWSSITGKAFIIENSGNAKLKVQFFWPFRGDYWVIELADDYTYAVVGVPSREYYWILSRTPDLDLDTYDMLIQKAEEKGFDVSKIVRTRQYMTQYPEGF